MIERHQHYLVEIGAQLINSGETPWSSQILRRVGFGGERKEKGCVLGSGVERVESARKKQAGPQPQYALESNAFEFLGMFGWELRQSPAVKNKLLSCQVSRWSIRKMNQTESTNQRSFTNCYWQHKPERCWVSADWGLRETSYHWAALNKRTQGSWMERMRWLKALPCNKEDPEWRYIMSKRITCINSC